MIDETTVLPWDNSPNLFPASQPKRSDVLYVIGNGLDKMNGMPCSYWDFREFCGQQCQYALGQINALFDSDILWSDFEYALGQADIDHIFDEATQLITPDEDHEGRYAAQMEDAPIQELEDVLANLEDYFHGWINQIPLPKVGVLRNLFCRKGLYMTFNYTETLENSYKIPAADVVHMHGKVGQKLVYGHCETYDNPDYESQMLYESNSKDQLVQMLNDLKKPVGRIISNHASLWNEIQKRGVNEVVVIGHSMAEVDLPYFDKINAVVGPNAHWYICWYSKDDYSNLMNLVKRLGLQPQNVTSFQFS